MKETADRRWTLVVLAIALLGAIPRVYLGVHHYIEYDGYWHVFIARQSSWEAFQWEYQHNTHPPLFFLLLRLATMVERTRLAYRAVSILAGLGAVFLAGKIATRVSRQRLAGALAALAMAGSMAAIEISCEVRSYALCVFFMLAAFSYYLDLLRADPGSGRRAAAGFAACSILALLSHYCAGFFVVVCVVYPVVLVAVNREFRREAMVFAKARRASLAVAGLSILAAGGALYFTHARLWVKSLNHLPGFYFEPGKETVWMYLLRNAQNTWNLFSPVTVTRPEGFLWLLIPLAGLALLAFHLVPCHRNREEAAAGAPLGFSLLMLGLVVLAAVSGRYPFGGSLRHQFFLFPFLLLAAVVFLDRLLVRVAAEGLARKTLAVCCLAVAVSSAVRLRSYPILGNELAHNEVQAFRAHFTRPEVVYLDQFNLIAFFIHHHDWEWRLEGAWTPQNPIQGYRLEKNGKRMTVLRDRLRWNLDPLDRALYRDLSACLRQRQLEDITVFCIQQSAPAWPPAEEFRARLSALAAEQGLQVGKLVVSDRTAYAALIRGMVHSTRNSRRLDSPKSLAR